MLRWQKFQQIEQYSPILRAGQQSNTFQENTEHQACILIWEIANKTTHKNVSINVSFLHGNIKTMKPMSSKSDIGHLGERSKKNYENLNICPN